MCSGYSKMHHKLKITLFCVSINAILICYVYYIGFLNDKPLLQAVQLKLKSMQQMNVWNSFWNVQIFDFLDVKHIFMPTINVIIMTIKHVRIGLSIVPPKEAYSDERKWIALEHCIWIHSCSSHKGKINLADIFTKEMKDTAHFVALTIYHRLSIWCCYYIFYALTIF
jgi:hypothetical protein